MKKITIISLMLMTLLIIALVTVIITKPREEVTTVEKQREQQQKPQRGRDGKRAIESFQAQQIAQMLELKDERLAKFNELYAEYAEATKPNPNERSPFGDGGGRMNHLSDEEIEHSIKRSYKMSKKLIATKETYYERFREFLSPREIALMYELERRTRERFLEEFQKRSERPNTKMPERHSTPEHRNFGDTLPK